MTKRDWRPRALRLSLLLSIGVFGVGWGLAFGPAVVQGQQSTSWLSPSQESGQFRKATGAFSDGGRAARFREGESHVYWGYGISLPSGAQVVGIEVRLDVSERKQQGGTLQVELSWNGGASWTSTGYGTGPIPRNETTILLGGPTDTWGRSWSPAELSNTNFRVRLVVTGSDVDGELDWLPVRVYYTLPPQSLSISPTLVDFGTLGTADYDRGYRELSPAQTITVDSGTDWVLYIQADSPQWSYSGAYADPQKPAGDLLWRTTSGDVRVTSLQGAYVPAGTSPALAAAGTPGTGIAVESHFRVLLSYENDPPGSYSLGIIYTLTTP